MDHLYIKEDDLILAMDRPVISSGLKLARVRASDLPALLVQRVARIRLAPTADAGFTYLLLQHPNFVTYLLRGQTGTQVPHVTLDTIRSFQLPLPAIDRQRESRQLAEDLLTIVSRTQLAAAAGRRRSRALGQSVFIAAFAGHLVPRDRNAEPVLAQLKRKPVEPASPIPKKRQQKVTAP
ncbi:MAG: hypothetical protein WAV54_03670 [Acidimicrobiales bacterium]